MPGPFRTTRYIYQNALGEVTHFFKGQGLGIEFLKSFQKGLFKIERLAHELILYIQYLVYYSIGPRGLFHPNQARVKI